MPWVERERIRYSEGDFASEEEARRWLEEQMKRFEEVEREFREFHQRIWRWADSLFERLFPTREERPASAPSAEMAQNLIDRIERLEKELKEIKELVANKYIKKKKEPKYAMF